MGTWGVGPFENDGAGDFLLEASSAPLESVRDALQMAVSARDYLDVDDGQAALAACELVALGFGYGKSEGLGKPILQLAAALGPNESLRKLALTALPKIARRESSELADLWHEGDGSEFDALVASLAERLVEAAD